MSFPQYRIIFPKTQTFYMKVELKYELYLADMLVSQLIE